MLQALLSGVASIKAQQTRMNVIGNNLANVNTTAYKGTRATFQEMIAQTIRGASGPRDSLGGTNPIQFGLGVLVAGTDTNNEQGSLQATNRPSDLAIQGNGFFMLSNSDRVAYTRDGGFDLDANGMLVQRATGERLVGWSSNASGQIDTSQPITPTSYISIPLGSLDAVQATTDVQLKGNLNASAGPTETWEVVTRVYDTLGGAHDLRLSFENRSTPPGGTPPAGATSSWEWTAYEGTNVVGSSASGSNERLYFDQSGNLLNPSVLGAVSVPATGAAGTFDVNLDFERLSQLNGENTVSTFSQNGFPPGSLQGFSIGADGSINGLFTNGLTRILGQIGMAIFSNPGGLERMGSNLWRNTDNSGIPVIGTPSTGGRGSINSGFLEQSNVDIGNEFTELIVTQRGFQANTRVVTTVDEMLQELINMKR